MTRYESWVKHRENLVPSNETKEVINETNNKTNGAQLKQMRDAIK